MANNNTDVKTIIMNTLTSMKQIADKNLSNSIFATTSWEKGYTEGASDTLDKVIGVIKNQLS